MANTLNSNDIRFAPEASRFSRVPLIFNSSGWRGMAELIITVIYSIPFADLKEETDGAQEAEIYFGASLGWEF